MRCRKLLIGGGIWALVLLFFWNTLYGRLVDKISTADDLFQFTSSSVGIQAPFLHAVAFLMIYLMLVSYFLAGSQIYQLYRMPRRVYTRKLIVSNRWYSLYFVAVYSIVYSICILHESSVKLVLDTGFFTTLAFYTGVLATFYNLFGLVFLMLSNFLQGRWKGQLITIGISVTALCIFYFTKLPTPFQGMDVFDMAYYQKSILMITYARRIIFNLLLIFVFEYLLLYQVQRKDVVGNEVL